MGTDNAPADVAVDNKSQIFFIICAIIICSSAIITFYKYIILQDFEVIHTPIEDEAVEVLE